VPSGAAHSPSTAFSSNSASNVLARGPGAEQRHEKLNIRVIPGRGIQVVDRALAQIEVLLERGPARREARVVEVAEDRDPSRIT
jgi:hypothetical protein